MHPGTRGCRINLHGDCRKSQTVGCFDSSSSRTHEGMFWGHSQSKERCRNPPTDTNSKINSPQQTTGLAKNSEPQKRLANKAAPEVRKHNWKVFFRLTECFRNTLLSGDQRIVTVNNGLSALTAMRSMPQPPRNTRVWSSGSFRMASKYSCA